jgi:hypothetical protein
MFQSTIQEEVTASIKTKRRLGTMADESETFEDAEQNSPEAGPNEKVVEFRKTMGNGYVGLEVMLQCNEPTELVAKNDAVLYSVNKSYPDANSTLIGDSRGPRITHHMVEAWSFVETKDDAEIQGSFAKSFNCQSEGGAEGYAEAMAMGSPAIVTLLLNMGAFVSDIVGDAEFPASGETMGEANSKKVSAACFYSEPGTNHRQINDQTMRMVFREKEDGATVISTTLGLEESSEFRPIAEQKYVLHPYNVQAGNGMEGVDSHSVIRPVSDFVADTSLAGKPIAMPLQPHRVHDLHEKLFDAKFTVSDINIDPKEEVLLVLMSIINRLHATYEGLNHENHWARLFWRLYRIIHQGKPGMSSTDPVPSIYPEFADDLSLQTRLMFNSITSVRLASLDGKTRLYSVICAQMLRRPEYCLDDLITLDKCNITHPGRALSMFRDMGKGATIGLVYRKSVIVKPEAEIPAHFTGEDMKEIVRYSNSVQTSASLNRPREFVDVLSKVINKLIEKGDNCASNDMSAPIDPVDLRIEHQRQNGRDAFAKFMKEENHFEATHASIVDTLMDETTGFAATVTIAFKQYHGLSTTDAAREKLLLTLKKACRTAYTSADMRATPIGFMALAMLVTDFCYSKTSLLKMKTLFVRGARPAKGMPIPWNRKGVTYHEETTRERASERDVSWITLEAWCSETNFPRFHLLTLPMFIH